MSALVPCHDCGAEVGAPHQRGCDVARCFWCGEQEISCACAVSWPHPGRPSMIWTGHWPGTLECQEMGLWAVMVKGRGWVACPAGTPGASEDLNRLAEAARWDPALQRYVPRAASPLMSYQDILDLHLMVRENLGEKHVAPPTDFVHNGVRLGQDGRLSLFPKTGDRLGYADAVGLYVFEVR